MKKQLLFLTIIAALFTASCKKDNSSTVTVPVVTTKFTFRGKAYTSKGLFGYSSTSNDVLTDSAIADDNSSKVLVNFLFKKGNSDVGTYNLINSATANGVSTGEIAVLIFESDLTNPKSTGIYTSSTTGTAVLANTGGKVLFLIIPISIIPKLMRFQPPYRPPHLYSHNPKPYHKMNPETRDRQKRGVIEKPYE
jgi:hypothetical protein